MEMQVLFQPISTLWSVGGFAWLSVAALLKIGGRLHQLHYSASNNSYSYLTVFEAMELDISKVYKICCMYIYWIYIV